MRFLLRFSEERITEDRGEGSSVAEAALLVAVEDCTDRLLRRVDDDELAKEIPIFCRVLDRWVFEVVTV
jgi:hypothetical protein